MSNRAMARGRGASLMEMLKKHQEAQVGVEPVEKAPAKARGRATLLQKIQEMKEAKAGGSGTEKQDAPEKPRVSERAVQEVAEAAQELSVSESTEVCTYRGSNGTPIKATANYIKLDVDGDRGVYEYEVRFSPDIDAKSNRIKLVNQHLGQLSETKVYDGDFCLYLPMQLYTDRKTFEGVIPNTDDPVTTIFIYKRKKKLSECLHLYNVLFKRIMHILLYTQMGRNYFSPENRHIVPQHKLEIYPGFAVSVDEMEGGLMVCLDTQHRVIRTQTAYELLLELRISKPGNFKEAAVQNIVGSCLMTRYNYKTYTIDDIAWEMSPKDSFQTRGGGSTTFFDYFKKQYNVTIKDVDQPMLICRKSVNMGGDKIEHMICLVPELSYFTGMTDVMRNDFKVMKDVAAYTRLTPNQRHLALRLYLKNVQDSERAQKILSGWGLKIAGATTEVNARVLGSESVWFADGKNAISSGDWNKAVAEYKVTGPIDLVNWLLFYTQRDEKFAHNFAVTITRLSKNMGCIIKEPTHVKLANDRTETYVEECNRRINPNVQAVVFICPTLRTDRYTVIKKICCHQRPVASQVVLSKTLANPNKVRTIIHKIALQINCKLGGTLWHVKIPFQKWLVCGIDVYHGVGNSSVCGFVSSINDTLTRWFSEAVFQEHEIGDFLKGCFLKALQQYRVSAGVYPLRVIVFRDGVSNGQLEYVRRHELAQLESALQDLNVDASITFVIVQKRINTRIFAMKDSEAENPPAGTVVDSHITRRNLYDFYLIPQTARQATVNPSHYIVLHDSANLKPDHLQRLAYKLCHLYYNWSGTIRVPAPCQYAHKLAGLVGQYIKKTPSSQLSDRLYYL